jgi:predicted TIM-barrel fold metal-dependent hydrolase
MPSLVVDCDSHVMEPATLWQEYLEPKYRANAIRIDEDAQGNESLVIADQVVLPFGLAGLGGVEHDRAELFAGKLKYADGCPAASFEPKARGELLDAWGVDQCVTFPTIGILPFPTDDLDLISAYFRAYNTWQADFMQGLPNRVIAIAVLNWRDVDAAVVELQRCLKLGFKGVFVPPETIDGKRPSHPDFDPIWNVMEAAKVPGCLHVIVRFSGAAAAFSDWHQSTPGMGPLFGFGLGATGQMIPALAAMVVDGFFDRHPNLNILSVEAGCGYAAYLMDRLDEKHSVLSSISPSLNLKPSEYIQRNCYFVAEPEERTIGAMLSLVGERNILWGSDYPHIDSTLAAPQLIRRSIETLSAPRQAAVLGGNATRLFGLS